MKTLLKSFFCLLLLAATGCSTPTPAPGYPRQNRVNELHAILDDYFESSLKLDPLFATSIGDHRYDAELTIPITEEYRKTLAALDEQGLERIKKLGCTDLPESEIQTCQTFQFDMESNRVLLKDDLDHLMPLNQFDSFALNFAELASGSSFVTFETLKDYENFMSRMNQAPAYLEAMMENMKLGMKQGITTPAILNEKSLKQLKGVLPEDYRESVFYKPLKTIPTGISGAEKSNLISRYEAVIRDKIYPAYQKLSHFVETEYLPKSRKSSGLSSLPRGRAYYLALAQHHTTTRLSPNEIMILGLSEVARIRKEFEQVKKTLKFKGSLSDFFKKMRTDSSLFPFKKEQEVLDAYRSIQAKLEKAIPDHFRLLPKARFEIREVEKFKADTASEAYQNATPDGSRPGIFWVPIPDPTKYAAKDMESLFLHEAIPGHHFQISIQQELDIPRYRRFYGNNAYVEGWALYTESLGKELGLYQDPHQWIGRLENEMHRAIRLVVDTGIHWKGWSRERAIRYSLENEPMDEHGITAEIERYMAIPGQALSYKLGELKIQELRSLAKKELGTRYRDPDFHDEILKDGALPLSVLDQKVKNWIQSKKQKVNSSATNP